MTNVTAWTLLTVGLTVGKAKVTRAIFLKKILGPLFILSMENAMVVNVIIHFKSVAILKIFSEAGPREPFSLSN